MGGRPIDLGPLGDHSGTRPVDALERIDVNRLCDTRVLVQVSRVGPEMLEVDQACKGAAIEDVAKAALARRGVRNELTGLRVTCPAGKSKVKDGKHYVDVLVKCIEFDTKKTVEQALRDNRIRCGVQWPRDLVPGVKTLRDAYEKATVVLNKGDKDKERTVNLANCHILIRPCYANNKLKVLFREPPGPGQKTPPFISG